jgi:hypothetical protein
MSPIHVACHCGHVQLRLMAPAVSAGHCHCRLCRHLSGAVFTTWVSVRAADVQGPVAGSTQTYAATPRVQRHVCPRCGVHVFTRDSRWPGIVGLPAGLLPDDAVPRPSQDWYGESAAPWAHGVGGRI